MSDNTTHTDWYKKCHTILINEIVPRAKKQKIALSEFIDPKIAHYLVQLEYQGHITRRELRSILDDRVNYLNDSIPKD